MAVMGARASEARRCTERWRERERRLVDTWRWRVERGSRYSREMRWRNLPLMMGCVASGGRRARAGRRVCGVMDHNRRELGA